MRQGNKRRQARIRQEMAIAKHSPLHSRFVNTEVTVSEKQAIEDLI
ncbi:MAG TPA: hypothetical protein V6C57_25480 [Coleofasciculaceae cyanobacterium]